MSTTVTTTLYPINDELASAAKSFSNYQVSINDTRTKVEDMVEKAEDPKKKVAYDENSNPFVQLYRWFAGTPWGNFEEKLKKYGLTLDDILAHLKANSANFLKNEGAIKSMEEIIAKMKDDVVLNTSETTKLTDEAIKAKKTISAILDAHLEDVKKTIETEYKPIHEVEAATLAAKQAKKRNAANQKRLQKAKGNLSKFGGSLPSKTTTDETTDVKEMKEKQDL